MCFTFHVNLQTVSVYFTCELMAVSALDCKMSLTFWLDRILLTFFSCAFSLRFFLLGPGGLMLWRAVLGHTDGEKIRTMVTGLAVARQRGPNMRRK